MSSAAKQARLRELGAQVVVTGAVYAEALEACLQRQRETGALLTHAYDQPEVVAGAGTLAREIEEQGGELPDSVLVSVGGGGLIAGIAAWFEDRAAWSRSSPSWRRRCIARARPAQPVDVAVSGIAADSLGAKRIGAIAWEITQRHVRDALLLPDAAIRAAQLGLWNELKLAVEPAAALGWRRCSGAYVPQGDENVAWCCAGANLDPAQPGLSGSGGEQLDHPVTPKRSCSMPNGRTPERRGERHRTWPPSASAMKTCWARVLSSAKSSASEMPLKGAGAAPGRPSLARMRAPSVSQLGVHHLVLPAAGWFAPKRIRGRSAPRQRA